jgi:1-acyl-sn-glycerol-3-phosphate acyltransferase
MLPPRAGIGRLAAVTRAPVLPVRITGSNNIRRSIARLELVWIRFGSPLCPPAKMAGDREAEHAFACRVMDAIAAL